MPDGYDEAEELDSWAIDTHREELEEERFRRSERAKRAQVKRIEPVQPPDPKLDRLVERIKNQRQTIINLQNNAEKLKSRIAALERQVKWYQRQAR